MSTTVDFYSNAGGDGSIYVSAASWSEANFNTMRAASSGTVRTGTSFRNIINARAGTSYLERGFLPFDSSGLPDTCTITAASINLYATGVPSASGTYKNTSICSSTQASATSLDAGDFDQVGSTIFSSLLFTSHSASAYNTFTLDSNGIANISKTGYSLFSTKHGQDASNYYDATLGDDDIIYSSADQTGTSQDPYLRVTYTTGLANVKTKNGLAIASVKTVNGLAAASVKSINGVT